MKAVLAQQELLYPRLYWNLKTALYPLMRVHRTGLESLLFGRNPPRSESGAEAAALADSDEDDF